MNEQYAMPAMPEGSREGILKGMYRLQAAANPKAKLRAQLFGSGAILNEVLASQKLLEKYNVAADVWSVPSYQELYRDGHACDRWNMLHPGETPRVSYVAQCLKDAPGVLVAASDYLKCADSIDQWIPLDVVRWVRRTDCAAAKIASVCGDFFEVDRSGFVTLATLASLATDSSSIARCHPQSRELSINPEKLNPARS